MLSVPNKMSLSKNCFTAIANDKTANIKRIRGIRFMPCIFTTSNKVNMDNQIRIEDLRKELQE